MSAPIAAYTTTRSPGAPSYSSRRFSRRKAATLSLKRMFGNRSLYLHGRWEIQFKGAGLTPYSRTADGRKVSEVE